ncbi:MAG: exodeoxyribonuclease VII large subunit, partial [Candidatus Marinimicrobia bacterium]|nr:exodeoxyribonuclease VII large subunit [Candidatus Neomarinimicrobiota bacterium]
MEEHIYTVSEIARDIKRVIEQFIAPIWIEGEVSNFTVSRMGHIYFSLKDQTAVLNCTIWRSQSLSIPFQIVNGMRLVVFGNVTTYAMQSQYQLNVQQVRAAGLGSLFLAFEALKKKLSAEGLFDAERKKPIPSYPIQIGVITSQTGAAVRDFLQVSRRRNPSVAIYLYPALVQGREAAATIIQGIQVFNRRKNVDFIVITRGGGSLEDLWTFNEEALVRAIAQSTLPVVSAVGHEVDFTLCDFVADLRAPTPSAAAEMTIPERERILYQIEQTHQKMRRIIAV